MQNLEQIELLPVLELEPMKFATCEHKPPAATGQDMPEAWYRYWVDCLADSGINGLEPLRPGSWQVSIRQFVEPMLLHKYLTVVLDQWGGPQIFTDPDSNPVLSGGFALLAEGHVLLQPTCCSDLGNLTDWRQAAAYQGAKWEMLWIGHPWLSIRYESPWLVISEPHESESPTARWAVKPDDLARAVSDAEAILEDFAVRLQPVLEAMGVEKAENSARKLAGLVS